MNKDAKIDAYIKSLNSKQVAPVKGYRRDVAIYELVCYVNNIICCYMSGNFDPIQVFIERAKVYLHDSSEDECNKVYIEMVNKFLLQMDEYLRDLES